MLIGDTPLRVSHAARRNGQLLTRRLRVWRIHIELEIRHYEKVIPQLVGEVGRIAQQGVQVAHHGDHGTRLAVALATVFDQLQRVDHLLDMTPILGQVQLASCVIIILFILYLRFSALFQSVRRSVRQARCGKPIQDVFPTFHPVRQDPTRLVLHRRKS